MNVLQNKLRIGILSGAPSFESKFIGLMLEEEADYIVQSFTENSKGTFIGRNNLRFLDSLDVMILEGFPGAFTRNETLVRIQEQLRRVRPGTIVFLNDRTDWNKFRRMGDLLPFSMPRQILPVEGNLRIDILRQPSIHPVLQVFENQENTELFWSKIPPLAGVIQWPETGVHARTLAEAKQRRVAEPVITLYDQQGSKAAVFNGTPFWRWHFSLQNDPAIAQGYGNLLSNVVKWIARSADIKPLTLKSNRNVVNLGENVTISANLLDAQNSPVKDGTVTMDVEWNDQNFQLEVLSDSSGTYRAEFWPPGAGSFRIRAVGSRQGMQLGEDQLSVEVIPFDKEFVRIGQNTEFLKRLAERYNGVFVKHDMLDPLSGLVEQNVRTVREEKEVEIWYRPFMLILILLLITIEWILRKRSGLV
jgi:hypothetical protein